MNKYEPLATHLAASADDDVPMTFAEIERVLGFALPPSAFRHRSWWSNNPSNSAITQAWLDAGFATAGVDLAARRLTFVRRADAGAGAAAGLAEAPTPFVGRHALIGCLAGTVAYAEDADLSAPADPGWASLAASAAP